MNCVFGSLCAHSERSAIDLNWRLFFDSEVDVYVDYVFHIDWSPALWNACQFATY